MATMMLMKVQFTQIVFDKRRYSAVFIFSQVLHHHNRHHQQQQQQLLQTQRMH